MSANIHEPQSRLASTPRVTVTPAPTVTRPGRLVSLDAYRGFIMLVLAMEGFGLSRLAVHFMQQPGAHPFWSTIAYQFDHTEWRGCTFWDLIQPSFMFMVGVAMPFSLASRLARGQSSARLYGHALWRSIALVILGIFLMSNHRPQTVFTFENVLTQIGLGYFFVFLLAGRGWCIQFGALAAILIGYWLFFALWPVPPAGFDYSSVELPADWPHLTGFYAHWDKNTNAAAAFDAWFLNLFPQQRSSPPFYLGGYHTLNFIPSMATMLFGLMAGEWLRGARSNCRKLLGLLLAGVVCLALGWVLDQTVCPSVKRIWTPSFAVFSTGWTLLMLAGFFLVVDTWGFRLWTLPLLVVGMNSIAIYCMAMTLKGWIRETIKTHVGQHVFDGVVCGQQIFDPAYSPLVQTTAVGLVLWLVCLWMYRRKIFLKI